MKIVSLFSGAGLFDAGLINGGNEILLQCEKEPIQLKILQETFPSTIKHNDILTLSKEVFKHYGIDPKNCAFVGGAPCQKHSHANPRRAEQLESKLLAKLVKLTYDCRPRFVLVENVYGFIDDPNGAAWLSSRISVISDKFSVSQLKLSVPRTNDTESLSSTVATKSYPTPTASSGIWNSLQLTKYHKKLHPASGTDVLWLNPEFDAWLMGLDAYPNL